MGAGRTTVVVSFRYTFSGGMPYSSPDPSLFQTYSTMNASSCVGVPIVLLIFVRPRVVPGLRYQWGVYLYKVE